MATPSEGISGLNLYNQDPALVQEYQKVLAESIDALKARYDSPNWFNVAAGFLKPQLGGFAASLGSAGAALGDWQEKQRANELTVAQMRAENARAGLVLGSKMGTARAQADVVKTLGGPGTPAGSAADLSARGSGDPNIVPAANAVITTEQTQAKAAYEIAKAEYARARENTPGAKIPDNVTSELKKAFDRVVAAGVTLPPGEVLPSTKNTDVSKTEPVPASETKIKPLPMVVTPVTDTNASSVTLKNNAEQIAEQNKQWEPYHVKLGTLVNTPTFQNVLHSLSAVSDVNPKYAVEVTNLVNKAGGWAALIADKGVNASVGSPTTGGINASISVPMSRVFYANLPDHLKDTYDIMANNLGGIDNAIKNGGIPGMLASTNGLDNQGGRALWHTMQTANVFADQAAREYSHAANLYQYTNPASATKMADVYQSEAMRKFRKIFNDQLAEINRKYHAGTVEKK